MIFYRMDILSQGLGKKMVTAFVVCLLPDLNYIDWHNQAKVLRMTGRMEDRVFKTDNP